MDNEVKVVPTRLQAIKKGIDVGAGVVDADYRGPVGVILFNLDSTTAFEVSKGDRIAQLILEKISMAGIEEVQELDDTVRGAGGFGSTGVSESVAVTATDTATAAEDDSNKKPKTDNDE